MSIDGDSRPGNIPDVLSLSVSVSLSVSIDMKPGGRFDTDGESDSNSDTEQGFGGAAFVTRSSPILCRPR
jgi:hypothetical protein